MKKPSIIDDEPTDNKLKNGCEDGETKDDGARLKYVPTTTHGIVITDSTKQKNEQKPKALNYNRTPTFDMPPQQ
jgi:hypothetical protein